MVRASFGMLHLQRPFLSFAASPLQTSPALQLYVFGVLKGQGPWRGFRCALVEVQPVNLLRVFSPREVVMLSRMEDLVAFFLVLGELLLVLVVMSETWT